MDFKTELALSSGARLGVTHLLRDTPAAKTDRPDPGISRRPGGGPRDQLPFWDVVHSIRRDPQDAGRIARDHLQPALAWWLGSSHCQHGALGRDARASRHDTGSRLLADHLCALDRERLWRLAGWSARVDPDRS